MTRITLIAMMLATACAVPVEDAPTPAVASEAGACTTPVRTVLYARFWRDSTEISCVDALDRADVVAAPLGAPPEITLERFNCWDTVPASGSYVTGVLVFDAPARGFWDVHVERDDGTRLSVDTVIAHDETECERGGHDQFVSFVLTAGRT